MEREQGGGRTVTKAPTSFSPLALSKWSTPGTSQAASTTTASRVLLHGTGGAVVRGGRAVRGGKAQGRAVPISDDVNEVRHLRGEGVHLERQRKQRGLNNHALVL
jgi:hypothetical protein